MGMRKRVHLAVQEEISTISYGIRLLFSAIILTI